MRPHRDNKFVSSSNPALSVRLRSLCAILETRLGLSQYGFLQNWRRPEIANGPHSREANSIPDSQKAYPASPPVAGFPGLVLKGPVR